jgi:hypothetical protein
LRQSFRLLFIASLAIALSGSLLPDTHGSALQSTDSAQFATMFQADDPPCEGHGTLVDEADCCIMSASCAAGVPMSAYELAAPELMPERPLALAETFRGGFPELRFRPPRLFARA